MRFKNRNAVFVILLLAACLGVSAQQAKDDHPVTVAIDRVDFLARLGIHHHDHRLHRAVVDQVAQLLLHAMHDHRGIGGDRPRVVGHQEGGAGAGNVFQALPFGPEPVLKKYVSDPRVTVVVTTINSKRIYVLGEVVRAGVFPMVPNMTVLQALSSAGGLQQYANPKKIYILRKEPGGKSRRIAFNYKRALRGGQTDDDLLLAPGDTVVVP